MQAFVDVELLACRRFRATADCRVAAIDAKGLSGSASRRQASATIRPYPTLSGHGALRKPDVQRINTIGFEPTMCHSSERESLRHH